MAHAKTMLGLAACSALGAAIGIVAAARGQAAWGLALTVGTAFVATAWVGAAGLIRAGREAREAREALERLAQEGRGTSTLSVLEQQIASVLAGAQTDAAAMTALLDSMDQPVVACDAELTVRVANRSAVAFLAPGSSRSIIGEPLGQLLTDARALAAAGRACAGESARAKARLLTGEGPRIVEVAAEPVPGGQPASGTPSVVLTLRDVTEQATAFQLKTDFVANASHELRTPLASIRAAAETLTGLGDGGDPMVGRLIAMIASNAERLEELSRDLLDLSRLESPETECEIELVDLHDVSDQLRDIFAAPCAERRIDLEFEFPESFERFWTDKKLIRLVLRNLIDNAIKFAYEDTSVRVRGEAFEPASVEGRLSARIEVIDKGIGIPITQQQRVFERFFQVDAARTGSISRRGTGLGLAIVKHAMRALGGTIRVESVWQQGTTMAVELPGSVGTETEPSAPVPEPEPDTPARLK